VARRLIDKKMVEGMRVVLLGLHGEFGWGRVMDL